MCLFLFFKGASKEIGTALTRVCLRHKAVETRLKTFTTAIMDCLVLPLQVSLLFVMFLCGRKEVTCVSLGK